MLVRHGSRDITASASGTCRTSVAMGTSCVSAKLGLSWRAKADQSVRNVNTEEASNILWVAEIPITNPPHSNR